MGAIQFIENLDRTVLTISDDEFERNVEQAVSAIAERNAKSLTSSDTASPMQSHETNVQEKSGAKPRPAPSIELSTESQYNASEADGINIEEKAAAGGILRSIQRPLSSIGRIFSDDIISPQFAGTLKPQQAAGLPTGTPRRLSPVLFQPPQDGRQPISRDPSNHPIRSRESRVEDATARQASAEAEEAQRIQRAEHKDVVEYGTKSHFMF